MVAGSQQVGDVLRSGQTAGVGESPGGPLQRGHDLLQRGARRVVGAAVLVRAELVDALLDEGARLVDRGGDGAGGGIGLLPGVNGARLEGGFLPIGGHAYYSPKRSPVMRRRSEAGDWGKKCLQIGRQSGNSSGDGDIVREYLGASAPKRRRLRNLVMGSCAKIRRPESVRRAPSSPPTVREGSPTQLCRWSRAQRCIGLGRDR